MKNTLKRKLYQGEKCFGTWITVGSPDIVDILKNLSFDWFMFDMEHSYLSTESVKTMMQALGETGPIPLVRLGQIDQYLEKQALDIGSRGMLAPLVNSVEEAERFVRFAMYPPKGVRGTGPGRASRYGANFSQYIREANDELLLGIQIETLDALSNAREILGTKSVDIGFAGPTDLTMSLGLLDDRSNPRVTDALKKVVSACEDTGKIPGTMAISIEEAKKFAELGFRFISLASDARFLSYGAKYFLETRK